MYLLILQNGVIQSMDPTCTVTACSALSVRKSTRSVMVAIKCVEKVNVVAVRNATGQRLVTSQMYFWT